MGCCGRSPRPSGSAVVSTGAAVPTGPVRFRVIPPVGDPVDNVATMEEAEAVRDQIGGEIKRVIS